MTARIGSLFSGYGGLDLGVQAVLGGSVVWHSDIDPGPSKILEHHWPGVPNLGDVAGIDFTQVEPVDIITGGFPCQDVSHAGRRAGLIRDGDGRTRSGLWGEMLRAVDEQRPSLVVAENVRGLLSAKADSDMESCSFCMGDGSGSPMRALGAVLADLADIGYDAAWTGLRAADVGAAHGRFRVFILAWPRVADADSDVFRELGGIASVKEAGANESNRPKNPHGGGAAATDTPHERRHRGIPARPAGEHGQPRHKNQAAGLTLLPTPSVADVEGGRKHRSGELLLNGIAHHQRFGDYAPAIARWETVLGRPAPAPTEPTGRNGTPRLSPRFVEWLMGLPAGHVTDVPGLTRNQQLKALGNGVVPQQAAAAIRHLLHTLARNALQGGNQ